MTEAKRRRLDKVVNDPIHGHIVLPELCVRIIDTVQFQRLRHIKQLGGCYLVYPGATHTRFEHSLGVCHLAGVMIRHLKTNQPDELKITPQDELCVQVAGLCHDLGHGPFSHFFEVFTKRANPAAKDWKHEEASKMMLKHLLDENKEKIKLEEFGLTEEHVEFIQQLINPPEEKEDRSHQKEYIGRGKERPFLYQIVANKASGVDVDKWDYFARDCHHLGMSSMFDHKRLVEFCRMVKVKDYYEIAYREKEVENIYEMFHTRGVLHRRAYKHKTTIAVEEMIMDAFLEADQHLKSMIGKPLSECYKDEKAYEKLTDYVYQMIQTSTNPELKNSRDILQRIEQRDLYQMVAVARIKENRTVDEKKIREHMTEGHDGKRPKKDAPDESAYFIKIVKIDYGKKKDDPLEAVNFYNKDGELVDVTAQRESSFLPKSFIEHFVRVYCRDMKVKDKVDKVKRCFEDWCNRHKNDVQLI